MCRSKLAQLQYGNLRKQIWKSRMKSRTEVRELRSKSSARNGYLAWESHAAGYELCHQVSTASHFWRGVAAEYYRSGITITAGYAIRQSSRLLKVLKL